jgi:hypothetical protein
MKPPTKSNHVLKSLDQLSSELLGAKAAGPEKIEQQEPRLTHQAEQRAIQPILPAAFEIRGYRGWGINE